MGSLSYGGPSARGEKPRGAVDQGLQPPTMSAAVASSAVRATLATAAAANGAGPARTRQREPAPSVGKQRQKARWVLGAHGEAGTPGKGHALRYASADPRTWPLLWKWGW